MAWQNEMVRLLRHIINDVDASTYTQERLEEILVATAQFILTEVEFDNTYTIDLDEISISPDPTTLTVKDNVFINFVILKAGCIVLGSEAKTLAGQAFRVVDGPSSIDVGNAYKAVKEMYDKMCHDYKMALIQYQAGNSIGANAILTPYTVGYVQSYGYNIY